MQHSASIKRNNDLGGGWNKIWIDCPKCSFKINLDILFDDDSTLAVAAKGTVCTSCGLKVNISPDLQGQ